MADLSTSDKLAADFRDRLSELGWHDIAEKDGLLRNLAATAIQSLSPPSSNSLEAAARKVLDGLNARIDAADPSAVPVFDGIADLHDALNSQPPATQGNGTEAERLLAETEHDDNCCRLISLVDACDCTRPIRAITSALRSATSATQGNRVEAALRAIVEFCDDPDGSDNSETLALGLARLLPDARAALRSTTPSPPVTSGNVEQAHD